MSIYPLPSPAALTPSVPTVDSSSDAGEVFYDVVLRKMDNQLERIGRLDAKATTLFTFASSALVIYAAFLSLAGPKAGTLGRDVFIAFLLVAAFLYLCLLFAILRAFMVSNGYNEGIDPVALEQECRGNSSSDARIIIARTYVASLTTNQQYLIAKGRSLQMAQWLAGAQVISLLVPTILAILVH